MPLDRFHPFSSIDYRAVRLTRQFYFAVAEFFFRLSPLLRSLARGYQALGTGYLSLTLIVISHSDCIYCFGLRWHWFRTGSNENISIMLRVSV